MYIWTETNETKYVSSIKTNKSSSKPNFCSKVNNTHLNVEFHALSDSKIWILKNRFWRTSGSWDILLYLSKRRIPCIKSLIWWGYLQWHRLWIMYYCRSFFYAIYLCKKFQKIRNKTDSYLFKYLFKWYIGIEKNIHYISYSILH